MGPDREKRVGALRARAALAVCVLIAALPDAAHPSENPRVAIGITEKGVRYEISLPIGVFDEFFPARRRDPDYIEPAERERAASLVRRTLKERNPVTIDGIRVKPVIEPVEFVPAEAREDTVLDISGIPGISEIPGPDGEPAAEGGGERSPKDEEKDDRMRIAGGRVLIIAFYGTLGRPRTVSMVWEYFPGPGTGKMYAGLAAFEDWQEIVFSQKEPEYVWHALERPSSISGGRPLAVAEAPPEAGKVHVPVVTLVLLSGVGVFLVVARRKRLEMRMRALVSGLVAVLAVALVGVGRAEVALPWEPGVERPGKAEALAMFETLHRNIYSAFKYKTEDDIYDVLAQSVDGPLLDAIYSEIYQSLILRDQGGAVCRIDEVSTLESELAEPDESAPGVGELLGKLHDAAFGVKHRWRVKGSVHHWGHTHTRVNEYVAAYTLEPRGPSWKITAAQVLDEKRVKDATAYGASK